ncbi:T cell receptor gamma variable 3 [Trichechus manatus latirostris]|uniref:T cell receptor gamma variable 3 n=1 Tax=Trichechus manatus latirostris TaxID=127582 RepID=UPI000CA061DA|nr:T cell receptor gamma variable 3 [Trichechus manatus latirostris]
MLWSLALHLAVLAPASLKASILEMKSVSITMQSGESVEIICDLKQDIYYIHWYRYQEGKTLQRILHFYFPSSKVVLDSGFSSEKYYAYKNTQRICKLVLENLQESDSGVYYCAAWDVHRDSDLPYTTLKIFACGCQQPWNTR